MPSHILTESDDNEVTALEMEKCQNIRAIPISALNLKNPGPITSLLQSKRASTTCKKIWNQLHENASKQFQNYDAKLTGSDLRNSRTRCMSWSSMARPIKACLFLWMRKIATCKENRANEQLLSNKTTTKHRKIKNQIISRHTEVASTCQNEKHSESSRNDALVSVLTRNENIWLQFDFSYSTISTLSSPKMKNIIFSSQKKL